MKREIVAKIFLIVVAIPTLLVGLQAFFDPQAIMDNVSVILDNSSGKSSTRAIYGGMHIAFGLFFIYGAFKAQREALLILALYATGFAAGRFYSLAVDGMPNTFIFTWIWVETILALSAWGLLLKTEK
ncbi:MAG: DUF4345 domain-containing protein [Saprospiraceae bacterium]